MVVPTWEFKSESPDQRRSEVAALSLNDNS